MSGRVRRKNLSDARRRIPSGDGRGLQNRQRVRESVPGWVRLPHASAKNALDRRENYAAVRDVSGALFDRYLLICRRQINNVCPHRKMWECSARVRAIEDGGITMSHTYSNLLFHVAFSTKERRLWLDVEIMDEICSYLGALVKEAGGSPLVINGVADHVHLLIDLPPTVNPADVMRFVKTNSSRWLSRKLVRQEFSWQKGYGIFSVSRSNARAVGDYIRRQPEHHRRMDFRSEFMELLKRNGVEFDEKYLWV